jgi:hypothetical protein
MQTKSCSDNDHFPDRDIYLIRHSLPAIGWFRITKPTCRPDGSRQTSATRSRDHPQLPPGAVLTNLRSPIWKGLGQIGSSFRCIRRLALNNDNTRAEPCGIK